MLTVDSIPADDRSSFYNLRSTWQKTPPLYNNQVFSNKALQELDDMVETQLDPAWLFFGAEGQQQDDQTRNRSQQSSSPHIVTILDDDPVTSMDVDLPLPVPASSAGANHVSTTSQPLQRELFLV